MTKMILLMRHAEAQNAEGIQRDFGRRLTAEGCETASQVGTCLNAANIVCDRILTSSADRTLQTAEIVAQLFCPSAILVPLESLYNSSARTLLSTMIRECEADDSCVMVVAHNPGIAELMCQLADKSLSVPPGMLAAFHAEISDWSELANADVNNLSLVAVIQDGSVAWQDPGFSGPISPKG